MKLGITTEKLTTPTKIIIPKVRLTDKAKTFLKNQTLKLPNKDKPE